MKTIGFWKWFSQGITNLDSGEMRVIMLVLYMILGAIGISFIIATFFLFIGVFVFPIAVLLMIFLLAYFFYLVEVKEWI